MSDAPWLRLLWWHVRGSLWSLVAIVPYAAAVITFSGLMGVDANRWPLWLSLPLMCGWIIRCVSRSEERGKAEWAQRSSPYPFQF